MLQTKAACAIKGSRFISQIIVILGSQLCSDQNELPTIEHRIRCAWSRYDKWEHILESTADMKLRAKSWSKTVLVSITWGLQTTRALNKVASSKLLTCQKCMFRRMAKVKRRLLGDTDELET